MTREEMQKIIEENGLDKRKIAEELKVSPMYVNSMLNGWAPIPEARAAQIQAIICRSKQ